jgi:hypothetical protein
MRCNKCGGILNEFRKHPVNEEWWCDYCYEEFLHTLMHTRERTNMSERPTREVMDLSLTAYLLCMGAELVGLARTGEDNRFTFTLTEIDDMENVILDFYNRKGKVDPLNFAEILRNLKAMLRNKKGLPRVKNTFVSGTTAT